MGFRTDLEKKEKASYNFWKSRLETSLKLLSGTPVYDQLQRDPDLEWIKDEVTDAVDAIEGALHFLEAGALDFSE